MIKTAAYMKDTNVLKEPMDGAVMTRRKSGPANVPLMQTAHLLKVAIKKRLDIASK